MLEKNGDLYACDHFAFPEYFKGNILDKPLPDLALSQTQIQFGFDKYQSLPGMCRNCDFLFACWGECPKNRFITTPEGENGLNYLCPGLRKYFSHVAPFMDHMVEQIRKGKSINSVKNLHQNHLQDRFLHTQTPT
jgi:uncharacterized protein